MSPRLMLQQSLTGLPASRLTGPLVASCALVDHSDGSSGNAGRFIMEDRLLGRQKRTCDDILASRQ